MNTPEIVMYARERFCPDVKRSRDHLGELGLQWEEHDIESEEAAASRVEQLTGRRSVPTIVIGDSVIVEPSNDELDQTLRSIGFDV